MPTILDASPAQLQLIQLGGEKVGFEVNNFRPYSESSVPLGITANQAIAAGIPPADISLALAAPKDRYTGTLTMAGGMPCIYG
jgi:hypothetical protein